jgi:hypothetical protein
MPFLSRIIKSLPHCSVNTIFGKKEFINELPYTTYQVNKRTSPVSTGISLLKDGLLFISSFRFLNKSNASAGKITPKEKQTMSMSLRA